MTPTKEQYEKAMGLIYKWNTSDDERDTLDGLISRALADEAEVARNEERPCTVCGKTLLVAIDAEIDLGESLLAQAERIRALETHLAQAKADLDSLSASANCLACGGVGDVHDGACECTALIEAESLRAAATRLIASATKGAAFRYTPWTEAGGGKQCTHLVNLGIECRDCDLAFLTKEVAPRQLTALAPRPNPACPSGKEKP